MERSSSSRLKIQTTCSPLWKGQTQIRSQFYKVLQNTVCEEVGLYQMYYFEFQFFAL